MTQSPVTVTYTLEEVLARIEGKIDDSKKDIDSKLNNLSSDVKNLSSDVKNLSSDVKSLSSDVNDLKVGQARIEERLTAVEKDVTEIKGSQKAQIWTLIGVLGTAVVGTVIRFVITALPGNP